MHRRRTAAAWFWLLIVLPLLQRGGSKPRLEPIGDELDRLLLARRRCTDCLRFTPGELARLAGDLRIDWAARAVGNWRFSPRHRLMLFLLTFSNAWPSRKLQLAVGWAANAVLNNWRWHIAQIVACLDAPGSRQCIAGRLVRASPGLLALTSACCFLSLSLCVVTADAIAGWTLAEQDAWLAAPLGPARFSDCIGIVDATYIRIQRPKNALQERRLYSTYKKYHAVFFLAIIDRDGTLLRVRSSLAYHAGRLAAHPWSAIACLCRPLPCRRRRQPADGCCGGDCVRSLLSVAASWPTSAGGRRVLGRQPLPLPFPRA
jgi:hypothetical protein